MLKPCTSCFSRGFYFLKYSKFPFLNKTWIQHNLFNKRRAIVWYYRFSLDHKGRELSKKRKTES